MVKKICVVTGSRAEYGLLRNLIGMLANSAEFDLQLVVTGMHITDKFGETYREIEQDGFFIDFKIDINLSSDSSVGVSKSISLGIHKFSELFDQMQPDILVVLGDRFEIFSAVVAATFANVPIAHIHGGELTEGQIDDSIRHSITKFSHLHFVSTERYRDRVIQLGESPEKVFCVGALGIDAIINQKLITKKDLESSLAVKFQKKNLLITYHPVTLEKKTSSRDFEEILMALSTLDDTSLFFTMPNADQDNAIIFSMIESFVKIKKNAHAFKSMGSVRYLSCMKYVDAVVGNSSSGIIEAPSLKTPTINVGNRQKGRIQAESILNCSPERFQIQEAIHQIYSQPFQELLKKVKNPYGEGGASTKILKFLKSQHFDKLINKSFFDVKLK